MKGKLKIKTKMKAIRGIAAWALLLALLWSGVKAHGQTDNFFYVEEDVREQEFNSGSWDVLGFGAAGNYDNTQNEASWEGFEYGNPLPTGAGLLALTVSGLCYAGLKRRKDSNIQ